LDSALFRDSCLNSVAFCIRAELIRRSECEIRRIQVLDSAAAEKLSPAWTEALRG